ncbi:hypothetical protein EJ08DRAFT_88031 [Tothia fuscella]|uniref:Nudix hydrolase domain-containing protein n=1 Tax=Tothia fuscella TaxID=1048955 RepID=A0A9P4NWQ6_9PEZI|nr:hypothetical protein EJ08DRAFT_88031 [Tothia fuscella]
MEQISAPVYAEFPARNFISGAGVAIFHVKSARVVLCYHERKKYWFLPKGRRDAGEESRRGAEREGFEESGYRNRILPLPVYHHQPQAHSEEHVPFVTEPVWTSLLPMTRHTQYLLHWYISETLPPDLETTIGSPPASRQYQQPPPYPADLRLVDRLDMELDDYEPPRYEGTGVDADELLYTARLVPVEEAMGKLGREGVMGKVIGIGWDLIQKRLGKEKEKETDRDTRPPIN